MKVHKKFMQPLKNQACIKSFGSRVQVCQKIVYEKDKVHKNTKLPSKKLPYHGYWWKMHYLSSIT
jgi:hypothetical protein